MPTVIIYWSPGRAPEQKKKVVEEVTQVLVDHGSARCEDVLVIFQDIKAGDAGRGGKMIEAPLEKPSTNHQPTD